MWELIIHFSVYRTLDRKKGEGWGVKRPSKKGRHGGFFVTCGALMWLQISVPTVIRLFLCGCGWMQVV